MEALKIDEETPDDEIIRIVAEKLLKKSVIVYPTDTVYGIGCTLDEQPVKRIRELKGRKNQTPLSVAFSNIEQIRHYTIITPEQEKTINKLKHEGTTFILRKKNIPDYVTAGLPTVGVRIPDNNICKKLIEKIGPIITTSANPTGKPAPTKVEEINEMITSGVDIVVDGGPCKYARPSKIIDLTQEGKILRA